MSEIVCGIIMPISAMVPDYTVEHWEGIRKALEAAIYEAGFKPQAVWENQPNDIIQGKILKNLYENDIIVCDVSGLNPNVMLELGLRLATGKPTILVADGENKIPFDMAVISHLFYRKNLEYHATKEFLDELVKKIKQVHADWLIGSYKSFAQNFDFQVIKPQEIAIPAEIYIAERLDTIDASIADLKRRHEKVVAYEPSDRIIMNENLALSAIKFTEAMASRLSNDTNPMKFLPREDLLVGSLVRHRKFGLGEIVEIEGNKLEIEFEGFGRRRVLDSFVDLVI